MRGKDRKEEERGWGGVRWGDNINLKVLVWLGSISFG